MLSSWFFPFFSLISWILLLVVTAGLRLWCGRRLRAIRLEVEKRAAAMEDRLELAEARTDQLRHSYRARLAAITAEFIVELAVVRLRSGIDDDLVAK
jgi:hypothetical protein